MSLKPLQILLERLVVFVGRIVLHNGDYGPLVNEPGEIVDVAIGIVADNTVAQPQDVAHAEVGPEILFDFRASQLRIAVGIEQAGLGGQQSSPSVHVDRAALQHDAGLEYGKAQLFGDPGRYDVIQVVRRILPTPGVEPPVDDGLRMLRIRPLNEDRSMISAPGVVRG